MIRDTMGACFAPIAQGIEHWSPEPGAQVRILVGALMDVGSKVWTTLVSYLDTPYLVFRFCFYISILIFYILINYLYILFSLSL